MMIPAGFVLFLTVLLILWLLGVPLWVLLVVLLLGVLCGGIGITR